MLTSKKYYEAVISVIINRTGLCLAHKRADSQAVLPNKLSLVPDVVKGGEDGYTRKLYLFLPLRQSLSLLKGGLFL